MSIFCSQKPTNKGVKSHSQTFAGFGPYIVVRVLPNNNYVVRKIGTHRTQTLHRMRIRPFQPRTPLQDIQSTVPKDWRPDPDVEIKPNEDLYAKAWETDFGTPIFDQDNEETNPQHQPEVTVDETQTAENSGDIFTDHMTKNRLENDNQPLQNNDQEPAENNREILGNEDKNVPENPEIRENLGDTMTKMS